MHTCCEPFAVRSGAFSGSAVPGVFLRKSLYLGPVCFQFGTHALVYGIVPSSFTFVIEYACWFQIGRDFTQRSAKSL